MWSALKSPELVFKVQSFFGVHKSDKKDDEIKFVITNKFFYHLFLLGTELGDELFYGLFIPIMIFNVDSFLGRRFVFHWFLNMYIGQALKEVFKEERPKKPAIQMQSKWSNEFSLPSTHAMGSLSIVGSILYFAHDRYDVEIWLGVIFITLWVGTISLSRVYLGMHSVLDIVVGAFLTVILLALTLPLTDLILNFFATNFFSPFIFILVPVFLIVHFPTTELWTPTRSDTCSVNAVFSGVELGTWINYQLGIMTFKDIPYPTSIEVGSWGLFAARTVVGLAIAGLTELIFKKLTFNILCSLINEDPKVLKASENSVKNTNKNFVVLTSNFVTYCILGFNCLVLVPIAFQYLNIQRNSFFTEL